MRTYGLPVVISNCSNNYGPFHFPEKLIPLVTLNALAGKPLPVYGKGDNIRDWLFVEDHARALWTILTTGRLGETYNVGGRNERTNLEVVETICDVLDELRPAARPRRELITFVTDRPGHDHRYAIDATKLETELGWRAREDFDSGIRRTVAWYLDNEWWWKPLRDGVYAGERLGLERLPRARPDEPGLKAMRIAVTGTERAGGPGAVRDRGAAWPRGRAARPPHARPRRSRHRRAGAPRGPARGRDQRRRLHGGRQGRDPSPSSPKR